MKKILYISIISFLMISLTSCYTTKTLTNPEQYAQCLRKKNDCYVANKNIKVLSIITKEKDTIFFSKKYPSRITENYIVGMPMVILPDSIKFDSITYKKNSLKTMWKDGTKYSFDRLGQSGFLCYKMDTLTIPLVEVAEVRVRHERKGATSALAIGSAATISIVTAFAIAINQLGKVF